MAGLFNVTAVSHYAHSLGLINYYDNFARYFCKKFWDAESLIFINYVSNLQIYII